MIYLEKYCHLYFIPLVPSGNKREIVKCTQCQAMYDAQEYLAIRQRITGAVGQVIQTANDQRDKRISQLLQDGQFQTAETQVRELLRRFPNDLQLMVFLAQALNGTGKEQDSDKLVSQIQYHWEMHFKQDWISQGCPRAGSSFSLVNTGTSNYHVIVNQYFVPQRCKDARTSAYYKVKAMPRPGTGLPCRLFKLENSAAGSVLREYTPDGASQEIISYTGNRLPSRMPDARKVAGDVVIFLLAQGDSTFLQPVKNEEGVGSTTPIATAVVVDAVHCESPSDNDSGPTIPEIV